jgi:hypothetical protein
MLTPFILMTYFTQSIHLFLGRPLHIHIHTHYSLCDFHPSAKLAKEYQQNTKQRSRVQIPAVSSGFCDQQLQLLTSHGFMTVYVYYYQYNLYMYDLCMFIRYLVPIHNRSS